VGTPVCVYPRLVGTPDRQPGDQPASGGAGGDREAEGRWEAEGLRDGDGDREGVWEADGVGAGERLAEWEGEERGEGDFEAVGEAVGEAVWDGDGEREGEAAGGPKASFLSCNSGSRIIWNLEPCSLSPPLRCGWGSASTEKKRAATNRS